MKKIQCTEIIRGGGKQIYTKEINGLNKIKKIRQLILIDIDFCLKYIIRIRDFFRLLPVRINESRVYRK